MKRFLAAVALTLTLPSVSRADVTLAEALDVVRAQVVASPLVRQLNETTAAAQRLDRERDSLVRCADAAEDDPCRPLLDLAVHAYDTRLRVALVRLNGAITEVTNARVDRVTASAARSAASAHWHLSNSLLTSMSVLHPHGGASLRQSAESLMAASIRLEQSVRSAPR